ncbi:MAG TPA: hypothetical protein VF259_05140, partial [Solirubrobacterales bacterium]
MLPKSRTENDLLGRTMRKLIGPVAAIVLAISALGAASASAATEFGDTCAADEAAPGDFTITTLSAPAGPLPLTAPSAGVITQVKVRIAAPIPFAIPTTVKALHSAGGSLFTVVGQTTVQASAGLSTAGARIPVQAGDRLALHGQPFSFEGSPVPSLSFYCEGTGDGSILGATPGEPGPGATAEFGAVEEGRVPLAAVLEPDADNDGYGDETQDQCPQSASTQSPCPLAVLSASAVVRKGLATILITSNVQTSVTVAGKVKLGKGKKARLNGGTQVVTPGTI